MNNWCCALVIPLFHLCSRFNWTSCCCCCDREKEERARSFLHAWLPTLLLLCNQFKKDERLLRREKLSFQFFLFSEGWIAAASSRFESKLFLIRSNSPLSAATHRQPPFCFTYTVRIYKVVVQLERRRATFHAQTRLLFIFFFNHWIIKFMGGFSFFFVSWNFFVSSSSSPSTWKLVCNTFVCSCSLTTH